MVLRGHLQHSAFTPLSHLQVVMVGHRISEDVRQQCRELQMQGHSFASIARQLRISSRSAKTHALRTGSTADLPRSGCPKVTNTSLRRHIKRKAKAGSTTVKIATNLAAKKGVVISRQTVGNVLKGGRRPLKWLPVTRGKVLRHANRLQRVSFCHAHEQDDWLDTVFIDSKYLYVQRDLAKGWLFRWQDDSKPVVFENHSNPFVFHFYAAVAHGHKSKLVFVPPTKGKWGVDSKKKVSFKSCHFLGAMGILLQEFRQWFPKGSKYRVVIDNAKQHTSKESREGLAELEVPVMQDFPAQCWDINMIEVCWAWMMQKLRGHNPRTWDGWMRAIKKAWAEVEVRQISEQVEKVPNQLQEILKEGGKWAKYYP